MEPEQLDKSTLEKDVRQQACMLETMSEAIFLISRENGSIFFNNTAAERIYGYNKGEMLNLDIDQLISHAQSNELTPSNSGHLTDDILDSLNKHGEWRGEQCCIQKDRREIVCSMTFTSFTHRFHGDVWLSVQRDITGYKKKEEALTQSEERLNLIKSDFSGILFQFNMTKDGKKSLSYVSSTIEKYLGLSVTEAIDDIEKWFSMVYPDDVASMNLSMRESLKEQNTWEWEGRFVGTDKIIRWVYGTSKPVELEDGSTLWDGVFIDISERKKSNERYNLDSQIIDQVHDSVISTDLDGFITSWNKGAERLFGFINKDMVGQHISIVYAEEDHAKLQNEIIPTLQEQGFLELEVCMLRKTSEKFYAHLSLSMLYDNNGLAIGMIGFSMDISQRKLAEQAKLVSEERVRSMIENVPGISYRCLCDKDWTMCFISSEIESISGYPVSDFINNKVRSFASIIHPDDVSTVENSIANGTKNHQSYCLEYRIMHKDGSVCWVFEKGQGIFDASNKLLFLDGVILDINEQKIIEKELIENQLLLEKAQKMAQLGYWKLVPASGEFTGSDELFHIFELSRSDLDLVNFIEVTHPEDRERNTKTVKRGIEFGENWDVKHRLLCRSGQVKWVHSVGEAVCNEAGQITALIGTIQDITEKQLLECEIKSYGSVLEEMVNKRTAELRAARDDANRANTFKSDFLAHMSHELRTPLNAILGFSQMLEFEDDAFNDTQKGNVQEILQAGRHLLALVNEILDLAKIDSGKITVEMETVDIDSLLKQSIFMIAPQAQAKNIQIIDKSGDKNYFVKADVTRLMQVVVNILSNAIKYNSDNGSVVVQSMIMDGNYLRVSVSDSGVGLSQQQINEIFTPFERLNAESNIEGAGIGLTITKKLLELMNGRIGVESKQGEGSTFWFELELI